MTLAPDPIRAAKALLREHRKEIAAARPKPPKREPVKHKRVEPAKDGRQRQPRQIDKAHKAFIAQLPCIATMVRTGHAVFGVHVCHVRSTYPEDGWRGSTGLQRKPDDWRTVPMLPRIHGEQHDGNEVRFWRELGVYPPDLCADLKDACPDVARGIEVIKQHAIRAMSAQLRDRRKA